MKGAWVLLRHSMKRMRMLLAAMGLVLGAFQIVLVAVAGSLQNSGGFDQLSALLPPFAREMMGPSVTAFLSFGGIVCLGYFHLVVMSSLVGLSIAVATVPASEVETGYIDLILSRPMARHWVITRTIVAVMLSIAVVLGLMMVGTWAGLEMLAPSGAVWPSGRLIRSLAGNLGLLLLCWSGVALAIGSASRRRAVAGGCTAVLVLGAFLLDYVARLWKPAESLGWLSPFRYYSAMELVLGGTLPLRNIAVLGGVAVAGWLTAYLVFAHRDLAR
jgi:ABC-2 type transport system permease protein